MANKVITFVLDTLEPKLDSILAAAVNEAQRLGHTVKTIRVADDSGETVVPSNTIAGVTAPDQPVTDGGEPVTPASTFASTRATPST